MLSAVENCQLLVLSYVERWDKLCRGPCRAVGQISEVCRNWTSDVKLCRPSILLYHTRYSFVNISSFDTVRQASTQNIWKPVGLRLWHLISPDQTDYLVFACSRW